MTRRRVTWRLAGLAAGLWVAACGARAARYVARVAYDGTRFSGWQAQSAGTGWRPLRTVQGVLSDALTRRVSRLGISIQATGASRTDRGVHARGQAAHFDLPEGVVEPTDLGNLQHSLNCILPDDLRVWNLSLAPLSAPGEVPFHSTSSALGKRYIYRIARDATMDPLQRLYAAHLPAPADWGLFEHCLHLFVGTHDFSSFSNSADRSARALRLRGHDYEPVRTVLSAALHDEGGGIVRVELILRSALYKMVRNMVGAAHAVACGRMGEGLLRSCLRDGLPRGANPSRPAPPHGLLLDHVYFAQYGSQGPND